MYIKHWNCLMWGVRRFDTRLAIDFGPFTLYIRGFPDKVIEYEGGRNV